MNEAVIITRVFLAGTVLGLFFFGGLWWTVLKAVPSSRPALWILLSWLVRTAVTLAGFYLAGGGHWQNMMVCLAGFLAGRYLVILFSRSARAEKISSLIKTKKR